MISITFFLLRKAWISLYWLSDINYANEVKLFSSLVFGLKTKLDCLYFVEKIKIWMERKEDSRTEMINQFTKCAKLDVHKFNLDGLGWSWESLYELFHTIGSTTCTFYSFIFMFHSLLKWVRQNPQSLYLKEVF